jgi:uncharacterized membrane protein YGL010W|tara:strand:- start:1000 stop:1494 length:495 start_codon:yes stop_codon:yes gene_type:complete
MRKIEKLIIEYGESHQNKTNKLVHWFCVPAIFFSIIALVWCIPLGPLELFKINDFKYINWATLSIILVLLYYILLSPRLTFGMFIFSVGCLYLTNIIENIILNENLKVSLWMIALSIFAFSWIVQFLGHKIEGKKPSFLKDVQFLLIGPAWLMHFIYEKLNIKY